jgi:threonine dehydrogenase-like Zn-dependent dehydrogenase
LGKLGPGPTWSRPNAYIKPFWPERAGARRCSRWAIATWGNHYASHAEIISTPTTLCITMAGLIDYESAAFVEFGGISLHAIRLEEVAMGETITVIGFGLLGLLSVKSLKANGHRVSKMYYDLGRCRLAQGQWGYLTHWPKHRCIG